MLSPALSEADDKAVPRLEEISDIFTNSRALPAKNKASFPACMIHQTIDQRNRMKGHRKSAQPANLANCAGVQK